MPEFLYPPWVFSGLSRVQMLFLDSSEEDVCIVWCLGFGEEGEGPHLVTDLRRTLCMFMGRCVFWYVELIPRESRSTSSTFYDRVALV